MHTSWGNVPVPPTSNTKPRNLFSFSAVILPPVGASLVLSSSYPPSRLWKCLKKGHDCSSDFFWLALYFTSNLPEFKNLSIFLIWLKYLKNALWLWIQPLPGRSASCFLQLLLRCGWVIHAGSESPTWDVNPFFQEMLTLLLHLLSLFSWQASSFLCSFPFWSWLHLWAWRVFFFHLLWLLRGCRECNAIAGIEWLQPLGPRLIHREKRRDSTASCRLPRQLFQE